MDEEAYLKNDKEPETENKSAISADLIRGHINTIILRTLYERDKYGYEIIEEIENKSHGQYSLKQPTLYSALKRLENQGYINAYWKTDEVSQGGRRKYYTLTESGKEITEKNQAEWEYSRTVIDNLISDRSFDFSKPAPNNVDFKILKKSTSRVPVVKNENEDDEEEYRQSIAVNIPPERITFTDQTVYYEPIENVSDVASDEKETSFEDAVEQESEIIERTTVDSPSVLKIEDNVENISRRAERENLTDDNIASPIPEPPMSEEQRRIVHENYLRLISEPVTHTEEVEEVPIANEINTEKLIYNNKPETERDYRNLINRLFDKTVKKQTVTSEKKQFIKQNVEPETEDIASKANSDGLKVNSSEYIISGSKKKSYNRGSSLLKSSLLITVVMLLEFTLCLIFKNELEISLAYPFVILAIAGAQLLIFGVLYYTDLGKNTRKPSSNLYLSACIIITIIVILTIFIVSLIIGVNFASAGSVFAKLIIPCFVAMNIPAFGVCFYLFSK